MTESDALVEARSLRVRYGKVIALDGLDLMARSGQVLAVLGTGTALAKTTFGAHDRDFGPGCGGRAQSEASTWRGNPAAVRREIGLAGQFAAVEPTMTGRENLEMVARLFGHQRSQARAASSAVIDLLDLGEMADRRTSTFSGGQRRRLDLGASLGAPRLLLLDEPTTGLDPAGRAEVWAAVRSLVAAGTDILLTTHYLEEADELADQVVVIDHGKAIVTGTVAEVKAGIGRDVIEVTLADSHQLATAASVLKQLLQVTRPSTTTADAFSNAADGGTAELSVAIAALTNAHVTVEEISLRHPTLYEVFSTLTADDARNPQDTSTTKAGQLP